MQQHESRAKQLRDRSGLTLEQVAQRAQVTSKTVWRLEKGKFSRRPHDDTLERIARVYGCRSQELIDSENVK